MYKMLQQQVQPRMLMILLISSALMMTVASYLYVLKTPLKLLRESESTLVVLQNELQTGIPLQQQIAEQERVNQQLLVGLQGEGPLLPMNQMVVFVIGELDRIAERHHVNLASVTPGEPGKNFTFRVLSFEVEITGEYIKLFDWLKDVESELGPVVINEFEIEPVGQSKEVKMSLTIANYQFEESS